MSKQSVILINGEQQGSLLFITNIVKGGRKGDPASHIGALEGFAVHSKPTSRWCSVKKRHIDDVEITKRQMIWTNHGGSYSTEIKDDIHGLYLDVPVITYILGKHRQNAVLPKPQLYRFIKFLGQPRVSVIQPPFKDNSRAQQDIFHAYASRGEAQNILINRKEHRFYLSLAHLSNLHACAEHVLSGEVLHDLLPYGAKKSKKM